MPKISIITINYNNLEDVKKTVECLVNQIAAAFQYFINDGDFAVNHYKINALI